MRKMQKGALVGVQGLFLLCTLLNPAWCKEPIAKSKEFSKPFGEVWDSTIEGLTKAGEIFDSVDKETGLIIIKKYEREISEYELYKIVTRLPYNVEWQSARMEGNIFVRALSDTTTRVICNFKIIATGMPYKYEDKKKVALELVPKEYLLESNGRIEQSYLRLIEEIISEKESFRH